MKLIKLTWYDIQWTADWKKLNIKSEPKHTYLNIDLLGSVSAEPTAAYKGDATENLYFIRTLVARGCGINGVDYNSYYVTEETYKRIMTLIDTL